MNINKQEDMQELNSQDGHCPRETGEAAAVNPAADPPGDNSFDRVGFLSTISLVPVI
jgi:hypothetical protein